MVKARRNAIKLIPDGSLWGYEVDCRGADRDGVVCCNGAMIIQPHAIRAFGAFRAAAAELSAKGSHSDQFKGFVVNRGYSCMIYNTLIGGHPRSRHMTGEAFDIVSGPTGFDEYTLARIAVRVGNKTGLIRAVGCYMGYKGKHGFVHIQTEPAPAPSKVGNVGVFGDFPENDQFYAEHPDVYRGVKVA